MALNTALQKIQKRAKQLKKENPKLKHIHALKKAGAEYRAGKISGARKVKPAKKKTVTRVEKVTVSGTRPRKKPVMVATTRKAVIPGSGAYKIGEQILKQIDRYEAQLKRAKTKERKDFLIELINSQHDELDDLKKGLKIWREPKNAGARKAAQRFGLPQKQYR